MNSRILTVEEVKLFERMVKHVTLINLLEAAGAFEVKGGSITINFDQFGQIGSIDKYQHYKA